MKRSRGRHARILGSTAGHLSVLIEAASGPVLLAGDAADLAENIEEEVAPGLCYRDDGETAVDR